MADQRDDAPPPFDHDVETVRSDDPVDDTSGGPLTPEAGEGSGLGADGAPDPDELEA